jgi:hypothetical protein
MLSSSEVLIKTFLRFRYFVGINRTISSDDESLFSSSEVSDSWFLLGFSSSKLLEESSSGCPEPFFGFRDLVFVLALLETRSLAVSCLERFESLSFLDFEFVLFLLDCVEF